MILLNRKKKTSSFGFAFFFFGLTLMTMLFHAFNYPYYNLEQGIIDITWASASKIIFTVVDWSNDIIFGYLSEKTKSRWGKRVPWLVCGSIFIPLFVILTYVIDKNTGWSPSGVAWYYIIISVSMENASTVMYTNYNALFPTLFASTKERAHTSTLIHIFEALGMATCYVLTPILREKVFVYSGGTGYVFIGLIYMAVYYISLTVMLLTSRFKDDIDAQKADEVKFSIRSALKDALTDKSFVFFHLTQSTYKSLLAIVSTMYAMYFTYCLGGVTNTQQSIIFASIFASMFALMPVWKWAVNKYSAIKLWTFVYNIAPFGLLLFLLPNDFVSGIIVFVLVCSFVGIFMITPDMLNAEIVDMDRIKHHISREASLASIGNLIEGISVIVSALITILLTALTGYKSGDEPGKNPQLTFRLVFGAMLPFIAFIGLIFANIYSRVSRNDRVVLHELKRKSLDDTTEVNINEVINEIGGKPKA